MKKLLGNVVPACLGLVTAMGLAEMMMRAFPNLVPGEVRVNPPARRVRAFLDELQQYGLNKQPQWVIMAYFEGNDLYDAASYEQSNPFILFRFGRYILNQSLEVWHGRESSVAQAVVNPTYPVTITINHKELEMVFFSSYISCLSRSEEEIATSQNYRLVRETILQVKELSEAAGSQFLLVYLPSKSHVYLPYLNDPETRARVFADIARLDLDDTGFIQFTHETTTTERTRQHMDDQARLLADFAAAHKIPFLNLTTTFQEKAGTGAELYYPFDTHWNQLGHDLAAEAISKYIEEMLQMPSESPEDTK